MIAGLRLRDERPADREAIFGLHAAAFETDAEAKLVDKLRAGGDLVLSRIAEADDEVVGHIALSPMTAMGDGKEIRALGLGPVAAHPDRRREGIGSALIEDAHDRARRAGWQMIFLLGDPHYYGRFGYRRRTARPFASPYAGRYWQALILDDAFALPKSGKADYARAFAAFEGV